MFKGGGRQYEKIDLLPRRVFGNSSLTTPSPIDKLFSKEMYLTKWSNFSKENKGIKRQNSKKNFQDFLTSDLAKDFQLFYTDILIFAEQIKDVVVFEFK